MYWFVLWELNSVVIWYRVVKQVCAFFILQLSLTPCAEQILNCAQEVGDQLLTCNGVSFTNRGCSSVLIWDAQSWSTKKRRRVWKLFRKQNCYAALNRSWTVYKRWVTKSWPTMEAALPTESLPQFWSEMLRLGTPKKWDACETHFGNRTVLLRGTDLELSTRDGWLKADPQWRQLYPQSLFLSSDLGC